MALAVLVLLAGCASASSNASLHAVQVQPPPIVVVRPQAPSATAILLQQYQDLAAREGAAIVTPAATPAFIASVEGADEEARGAVAALREQPKPSPPAVEAARRAVAHLLDVLTTGPSAL